MVIWSLAEASDVYILAVLHFPCAAVYENPHFASTSAVSVYHVHKSHRPFYDNWKDNF